MKAIKTRQLKNKDEGEKVADEGKELHELECLYADALFEFDYDYTLYPYDRSGLSSIRSLSDSRNFKSWSYSLKSFLQRNDLLEIFDDRGLSDADLNALCNEILKLTVGDSLMNLIDDNKKFYQNYIAIKEVMHKFASDAPQEIGYRNLMFGNCMSNIVENLKRLEIYGTRDISRT